MNQKDNFKSALPMAALDEIPQPSENAKEIVGLVKELLWQKQAIFRAWA